MDEYLAALEEELRSLVVSLDPAYDAYYGMFRYHLGWVDETLKETRAHTGKRVRPLVCLLTCESIGGDWSPALPVAAAIELAHNFSLIHDDIEDQSDQRRGRTAVWKVWGLAHGLNAGDGMFVLARLALDRLYQRGLPVQKCSEISTAFDAATLALCQGQFLDLGFESRLDVSQEEYMRMIRGKTAALIGAAARTGALVASDDAALASAFGSFGENIGLAFQITDDLLGIWGDPAVTGKSAATDVLSKKKSFPVLVGLGDSRTGPPLREIYRRPSLQPEDVPPVLELLDAAHARERTQRQADDYRTAALAALDRTGLHNRAMDRLHEIASLMTERTR